MDKIVTHIKFKGDGSFLNPEDGVNWQLGFDHGLEYGLSVIKIGKKYNPFPGDSNKGWFGNGFAEGVKSAYIQVLNRDYPNWCSVGYEGGVTNMDWCIITFKNGNWVRIKCE